MDSINNLERENLFQAEVIKNMMEGVVLVRLTDTEIVFANPVFEQMFGYQTGEMNGKTAAILNAGSDEEKKKTAETILTEIHQSGGWKGEIQNVKKDGSTFWCFATVIILDHPSHGPVAVSIHTDITERKRLEDQLSKTINILNETGSIAKVGGWELDIASSKLTWTDETFRILEVEKRLDQQPVLPEGLDLFAPDSKPIIEEAVQRAIEFGEPYSLELEALTAKGNVVWVYTNGKANFQDGKIVTLSGTIQDINTRKLAELDRSKNAAMLQGIFDNTPVCMNLKDTLGRYILINKPYLDWFGLSSEDVIGKTAVDFLTNTYRVDALDEFEKQVVATGKPDIREIKVERFDGKIHDRRVIKFPVKAKDNQVTAIGTVAIDLTDRVLLEEQLRQAQRMEAVGQLTGGVAHDFNNLLGVMLGNAELLQIKERGDEKGERQIATLIKAVERASSLTDRLLAFSRQQSLAPIPTDIANLVVGLEDMIRRTLGETIDIALEIPKGLWDAMVDPHQLEHALLNLVINARDVMIDGGTLTIKTSNSKLDGTKPDQYGDVRAGDYVKISVCDTGTGMTPEVQEKAFEPFFTTKEVGEGSGLGLSMVFGLIKQSNGHISIDSKEGTGTTISIYLPVSKEEIKELRGDVSPHDNTHLNVAILLVEDDPHVRETTASILRNFGCTVFEAEDGPAALNEMAILKANDISIDLLLSDVIMPKNMSGVKLAEEITSKFENVQVLLTSGYPDKIANQAELAKQGIQFIAKPYKSAQLKSIVEKIHNTK
jgi:PAS domain S-box-containing protein